MSFLLNYINWHYFEILPALAVFFRNLTLFPFYYTNVPLHIKTFFYPWKKQSVKMGVGFHIDELVEVFIFNLSARVIGLVVRTIVILYGIFFMLFFAVLSVPLITVWILLPFATIPLYLAQKPDEEKLGSYFLKRSGGELSNLMIIVLKCQEGEFVVNHLNLDYKNLLWYFQNRKVSAKDNNNKNNNPKISDLILILSKNYPPFIEILENNNIKPEEVYETAVWFEKLSQRKPASILWDLKRIKSLPGIGTDWAYGYTLEFDKYSTDLTGEVSPYPYLWGRDEELEKMERILLKTSGNNILVTGEPGVGRHILIETLAHRILTGETHPLLSHKRVLMLNMNSLIAAKPTIPEAKGLAQEILKEAEYAGNIIIVVDQIDKFIGNGQGQIDFSDVLTKFSQSGTPVIGITTPAGYHAHIEPISSFSTQFEVLDLPSITKETALTELMLSVAPVLEKKYNLIISFQSLVKTIEDADRFLTKTPFPAKAIELLDETCVYVATNKKTSVVTPELVDEFLTQKIRIPIGNLKNEEKEKLANLESILHQSIINQETAIHVIASALRRRRLDISTSLKPIGTFLFLGPTGVGKTETAKALGKVYFGGEKRFLRFDMSQYQTGEGLERLIGSVKMGTPGELTSKLNDLPFSLLLFDEFEKSPQEVFNLFLTLLDEGYITSATGTKSDARNSIIIATSNAGSEFIREALQQGLQGVPLQRALLEHIQTEKIFSPELLNRFDAVVVFTPLSEGQMREVAKLMLINLNERLKTKEISVSITDNLINKLVGIGFDPQFGARSMRRYIQDTIEDQIARQLLTGVAKKGGEIKIEL